MTLRLPLYPAHPYRHLIRCERSGRRLFPVEEISEMNPVRLFVFSAILITICYAGPSSKRKKGSTVATPKPGTTRLPSIGQVQSIKAHHVSCNSSEYRCDNGRQCVQRTRMCNGYPDCEDGSDEGGKCDECQVNNGGCDHECRNTPHGAECRCKKGYRSIHDGRYCEDEDECAHGRGYCQHYCHNIEGSYTCSCAPGYTLQKDGSSCKLDQFEAGFIYFSVGHQVRNLPFNSWHGLPPKELPDTGVMCDVRMGIVEGMDANFENSHYYYTRHGGIYAHNEAEICLVQGLHADGTNVAVDWITENLYFVNEDPPELGVCRSDGRFCALLFNKDQNLGILRGLTVCPKYGLMFWTDWDKHPKIERANMDGTGRTVIVDEDLSWPNAIAIDYVHNLLYFADAESHRIERCKLDGLHREVIFGSGVVVHPFDMAVFDEHVFWTDWGLYGVMTARVSNKSDRRALYYDHSSQPYGIAIVHPAYQQKDLPNPCQNMSCSHMCALTARNFGLGEVFGSCLCPLGYQFSTGNKEECVPMPNETVISGPRWCLDSFVSACENGNPCENGGKCVVIHDDYETPMTGACVCPSEFGGEFCEVRILASAAVEENKKSKAWVPVLLVLLIFLILTALCVVLLRRYGQHRNAKSRLSRLSPSVIFSKAIVVGRNNKDPEQRQRMISTTDDSSKPSIGKSESFANPLYEDIQVPVNQAFMLFKHEGSIVSRDSDADSGLEFNTPGGSP